MTMKFISFDLEMWCVIGVLMFLFLSFTSYSKEILGFEYSYERFDEVTKECGDVLSSASELKSDNNLVHRIEKELFFLNGDWSQEGDKAPLIPFDDKDMPKNDLSSPPMKFASFWVTDVSKEHRSKKTYGVNAMLFMGMTRNGTFGFIPFEKSPHFQMWPGNSQLVILFQGFYFESDEDGGQRVLCLLGNAMLPSRHPDSTDPWEWVKSSSYDQIPLLQEDRISLVLRYPKVLNLTSRAVFGEMKSLSQESNLKYFDKVRISSQLGSYSKYEFGSEELLSKACSPYPYKDDFLDSGFDVYKGFRFCRILERFTSGFTSGEGFDVVSNWKCNGTDDYCSKLGPFTTGRAIRATDGGFDNVKLLMYGVRCEPESGKNNSSTARVSAVIRAVSPVENVLIVSERSGFSNMSLSLEGIWNSSSGQLCMVGCLGPVGGELERCASRVCLYIPMSFSIKQRSIVVGSISSINNTAASYFPLSFKKVVQRSELWDQLSESHISYKYSKLETAGAFLDRSEPFDFRTVIKKSFMTYPTLEDEAAYAVSLALLSEDLTLHVSAVPVPLLKVRTERTSVQMEIFSLGSYFGYYWSSKNSSSYGDVPFHPKAESTEKELLMNVSCQLTLTGKPYSNMSMLFLEGLYDSRVGKMYLIGCRDVRASWKILYESMDLEDGLDCLIEVKVEYPPTTARWLTDPAARISIVSRRNEDDPLYFSSINLQTFPILYRQQREDILSRKGIEGLLRILTLSLAISFMLSQLNYIRDKLDDVPYMSLVMLGVQALGYSIPLITGAEAVFRSISSESYETPTYDLEKNDWFTVVDYTIKLLVLVAFLLTLRLCQMVWIYRSRLLTRTPREPGRVPSDRCVLLFTSSIHTVGFIIVLIVHAVTRQQRYRNATGILFSLKEWQMELGEYVGLAQDFFLLPQIVGNIFWQINCKPLGKAYYFGITAVRLLPHVYAYVADPVSNPYFSDEYLFVNPSLGFYSRFGDITIPVTAVVLAIVVYIQQRWSYPRIIQKINSGPLRFFSFRSKAYERVPNVPVEAELGPVRNGSVARETEIAAEE